MTDRDNTASSAQLPRLGPQLAALSVLLIATLILYTSQGLTHTLVPLRLGNGMHSGIATAGYYFGFGLGAFFGGSLIQRVGHIRAFGGILGVIVLAVLILPLADSFWLWVVVRVIHGAAISTSALIIESWLVGASDARSRGRVLAVYTLAVYGGIGLGPLFLMQYDYTGWEVFSLGAMLLCVAAVPVLFWRVDAPYVDAERAGANLKRLFNVSSISMAKAGAAGLGSGAFTALAPLYALSLGLEGAGVGTLMSVTVLLGLVLQWPMGHISDRMDRRRVLIIVAALSAFSALGLVVAKPLGMVAIYALLSLFQGTLYALYPLALAYANDTQDPKADTTDIASGLLLVYGISAAVGPAIAGVLTVPLGPGAGFLLAAVALAAAVGFGLWQAARFASVPLEQQGAYVNVVQSTPEVFELEPRTVPDEAYPP